MMSLYVALCMTDRHVYMTSVGRYLYLLTGHEGGTTGHNVDDISHATCWQVMTVVLLGTMLMTSRGRVVKGVGHLDHVRSYGVREVVSSIPDRAI